MCFAQKALLHGPPTPKTGQNRSVFHKFALVGTPGAHVDPALKKTGYRGAPSSLPLLDTLWVCIRSVVVCTLGGRPASSTADQAPLGSSDKGVARGGDGHRAALAERFTIPK